MGVNSIQFSFQSLCHFSLHLSCVCTIQGLVWDLSGDLSLFAIIKDLLSCFRSLSSICYSGVTQTWPVVLNLSLVQFLKLWCEAFLTPACIVLRWAQNLWRSWRQSLAKIWGGTKRKPTVWAASLPSDSSSECLLLFIFQNPQVVALHILSRVFRCKSKNQ